MESEGLDANDDHHFQGKLIVTCSHYGLQFVVSLIIGIILVDPSGLNIVSKISCLHLLELLKLFYFKILFSSATVAVRFSSRSLLTGLWRKTSTWRTILMKRRNRPYIYCIYCIWHLTFVLIVLIVFADWDLEKNSTRMAILMKRKSKIYKSTNNTFTPPPHRKEKS